MLSLIKEEQHYCFGFPTFKFKSFMTDQLNIIFEDFGMELSSLVLRLNIVKNLLTCKVLYLQSYLSRCVTYHL